MYIGNASICVFFFAFSKQTILFPFLGFERKIKTSCLNLSLKNLLKLESVHS